MLESIEHAVDDSPAPTKLVWFLLTLVTGLVIAMVSSWASTTTDEISKLKERQVVTDKVILNISRDIMEINIKMDVILHQSHADNPITKKR